jgi:hypothetical protein
MEPSKYPKARSMINVLELLKRNKGIRKSGSGWIAQCPAHDDKQSSLSVSHKDGKWLLKCHAGCDIEAIFAAAGDQRRRPVRQKSKKTRLLSLQQPRNRPV